MRELVGGPEWAARAAVRRRAAEGLGDPVVLGRGAAERTRAAVQGLAAIQIQPTLET
jgi:hypothetical protein